MVIKSGTQLGPYEILSPLGAGGMGEVYRAKDTRLDREVAIKVLPDEFARDPERVARFQREAKVLASLNHPNIAAIYGFETMDGAGVPHSSQGEGWGTVSSNDDVGRATPANNSIPATRRAKPALHFLVMELVEGETLSVRLKNSPISVDEALEVCKQIAEALEAAHESGVIHRDLKPANVKVTPDGMVKVLDFGLAKAFSLDDRSQTEIANSPTITADFTQPGMILGTAAYMSPEQARGKPIDKRTDIWSFGCVLYESLGGRKPFESETSTDLIAKILEREPEWSALPSQTPPNIQLLLRRCLTKDRNRRLRDIGDALIEIDNAINDPTASTLRFSQEIIAAGAQRRTSPGRIALMIAGTLVIAVLGFFIGNRITSSQDKPGRIFSEIPPPKDVRIFYAGDVAGPATVSPDGKNIVFVGQLKGNRHQLWLRRLDSTESKPLNGTEGATFPFWSPDSRSIGFFGKGEKLKRIDLSTGTTLTICDATTGRGGSWMKNDTILFSPDFQVPIHKVRAAGGIPSPVTKVDTSIHTSHRWPYSIGDGHHFLFSAVSHDPSKSEDSAIYIGSLDGTPPKKVIPNLLNAEYVSGHLLFAREQVLMAAPFDVKNGRITGDPVAVVRNMFTDLSTWRCAFSASPAGVLAYHVYDTNAMQGMDNTPVGVGGEANVCVWYDRTGRPVTSGVDGVTQVDLRLSPDGHRIAISVARERGSGFDIWIYYNPVITFDSEIKKPPARVTFMQGSETAPVWSPDGLELAFSQEFAGPDKIGIYRKRIGGGMEKMLVKAPEDLQAWPTDWSRDGKYIIYMIGKFLSEDNADIWVHELETGNNTPLLQTPALERGGQLSPNGLWLAYVSDEKGEAEIYVIPFVKPSDQDINDQSRNINTNLKWQISVGGGTLPRWNAQGNELYYISLDAILYAVSVNTEGDTLKVGSTTPLFQTSFEPGKKYDVSPEGEFVFNETSMNEDTPISLIVNWQTVLEK